MCIYGTQYVSSETNNHSSRKHILLCRTIGNEEPLHGRNAVDNRFYMVYRQSDLRLQLLTQVYDYSLLHKSFTTCVACHYKRIVKKEQHQFKLKCWSSCFIIHDAHFTDHKFIDLTVHLTTFLLKFMVSKELPYIL